MYRIAIVNLNEWSSEGTSTPRPVNNVTLAGVDGVQQVEVKYLTHPDGAAGLAGGITYGGSQWTAESMGEEVKGVVNDTVVLEVSSGTAYVPVPYTTVAIVFL